MLQEPPVFGPELDYAADVAPVVGIEPDGHLFLSPRVVSTGVPQVVAYVCKHVDLSSLRPDYDAIGRLLAAHDAIVLYVVQTDKGAETARARSFTATAEMGEDPATGSAAGPLVADLADRKGQERVVITQGVDMGRPSELVAEMEGDRPRVGGEAVVLFDGYVEM
jgi:trans-2,3-dihydro-3-hydroxyanthranilate isomerase